jgi:hypothetical protein
MGSSQSPDEANEGKALTSTQMLIRGGWTTARTAVAAADGDSPDLGVDRTNTAGGRCTTTYITFRRTVQSDSGRLPERGKIDRSRGTLHALRVRSADRWQQLFRPRRGRGALRQPPHKPEARLPTCVSYSPVGYEGSVAAGPELASTSFHCSPAPRIAGHTAIDDPRTSLQFHMAT